MPTGLAASGTSSSCSTDRRTLLAWTPSVTADLLRVLADRDDEDHVDMLEWVGGSFDSEVFDPEAVNERLRLTSSIDEC